MCVRGGYSTQHVGVKHCKRMASLYKHMGDIPGGYLQYKGVNQISKIITFLDSSHSACPCKNHTSKCCPELKHYIIVQSRLSELRAKQKMQVKVQISGICACAVECSAAIVCYACSNNRLKQRSRSCKALASCYSLPKWDETSNYSVSL